MGTTYLLDSNVIIYLVKGILNINNSKEIKSAAKNRVQISVITKIEVLGYNPPTKIEEVKNVTFISNSDVISISDEIVEKTIEIRKAHRIKLPDAIIAATALVENQTLISRNISDFSKIKGLKVVDPFPPAVSKDS